MTFVVSFPFDCRDLGSSLENLRVLWMGWCSLSELDGIAALSSLEELYLCYNSVRELQALFMLEQLRVLDLEGNAVDDMRQVAFLGFCTHLSALSLAGNPVTRRPDPLREPDALTVPTEDGALETQIGLDDDSDSLLVRFPLIKYLHLNSMLFTVRVLYCVLYSDLEFSNF